MIANLTNILDNISKILIRKIHHGLEVIDGATRVHTTEETCLSKLADPVVGIDFRTTENLTAQAEGHDPAEPAVADPANGLRRSDTVFQAEIVAHDAHHARREHRRQAVVDHCAVLVH